MRARWACQLRRKCQGSGSPFSLRASPGDPRSRMMGQRPPRLHWPSAAGACCCSCASRRTPAARGEPVLRHRGAILPHPLPQRTLGPPLTSGPELRRSPRQRAGAAAPRDSMAGHLGGQCWATAVAHVRAWCAAGKRELTQRCRSFAALPRPLALQQISNIGPRAWRPSADATPPPIAAAVANNATP